MKSFDQPIILMGGSDVNWKHLHRFEDHPIVAVDGGGNDLFVHGLNPQYVCGDFDSINDHAMERLKKQGAQIVELADQSKTDFAKALEYFDAPVIYAYGFLDGRLDHGLDALAQLAAHADKRIYLIGKEDCVFVFPTRGEMRMDAGVLASFWSVGQTQIEQSHGLKWSLDGMTIDPSQMSISNEANGEALTIHYAGDALIALFPLDKMSF